MTSQPVQKRTSAHLTGKRTQRPPPSPPQRKTKRRRQGKKPTQAPIQESEEEDLNEDKEYEKIDEPSRVTHLVPALVHASLSDAWIIQPLNPMWFIFDGPSPARHFKRGVPYNEKADFPGYSKPPYNDLTEMEPKDSSLMPFAPVAYRCICDLSLIGFDLIGSSPTFMLSYEQFMNWTQDELQEIEVGKVVTRRRKGRQVNQAEYTTRRIPAPYDRIVSQLLMEEAHGASDADHEAVCRQTYAQ